MEGLTVPMITAGWGDWATTLQYVGTRAYA